MIEDVRRRRVQTALLDWYRDSRRDLPWRATRDPYRILVSEIMLQQTQAERVISKYHQFLISFPTLQSLADAPASEVIRAWAGLGYNRRALNLQRACRDVVARFGGTLPADVDDLKSLPGVGPYTAGAVACFAYGADVSFVDTNIRRVLHRVAKGPELPAPLMTPPEIQCLARDMLPVGKAYDWNQALMELGATVCRARRTDCEHCPLQHDCRARPSIQDVLQGLPRRSVPAAQRFEQTSRYARGRIIDVLRSAPDDGWSLERIGRAVKSDFSMADIPWLRVHLRSLVLDGLVAAHAKNGATHEDSPPYDGESTLDSCDGWRYALPS